MSLERIKKAIQDEKFVCPECRKPIRKFDKYVQTSESVWDGAGDSQTDATGSKVTLICGNDGCKWNERTEYWDNYLSE